MTDRYVEIPVHRMAMYKKPTLILLVFILALSVLLVACSPEMFGTPPVDNTPATLSGRVEMSSAPPYLNDPVVGSAAVVVVFFNLDNDMYWSTHTEQGNPIFQVSVSPGAYQIVAYGPGAGGLPYVSAGYTGENPSCDQPLKTIIVEPGAQIKELIIADWNWTCGGTASRQDKPTDVQIP